MNEVTQKWVMSGQMVDRKFDENIDIVQSIPGLSEYHQELKAKLPVIFQLNQSLNKDLKGQLFIKSMSRTELVEFLIVLSKKMVAAGHICKNGILEKASKVTHSELMTCSDEKLIARGRNMQELMNAHADDLRPYGVAQPEMELLTALLGKYSRVSLEPRYTRAEHRESSIKMKDAFASYKSILKSIDLVLETVRTTHTDFYIAVREVRRLDAIRISNVNLAGKIMEFGTRTPINNVKVTLTPEVHEMKYVDMMVINRSGFRIKNLDSGFYLLKAGKPGYKDYEQRVTIISNEKVCVEIFLEKV